MSNEHKSETAYDPPALVRVRPRVPAPKPASKSVAKAAVPDQGNAKPIVPADVTSPATPNAAAHDVPPNDDPARGFDRSEFLEQIKMQLRDNPDLSQFKARVLSLTDGRPSGGEIVCNGIVLHFSTHPMGEDGATFERIAQAIVARAYAEIVSCPHNYSDEYLQDIERAIHCLGDFIVKANAARAKQFPI